MQKYNSKLYTAIKTSLALVPCGGPGDACEICDLYTLANNLINFALFSLATPILVLALLIGGLYWLTSGGSEERITKGKDILKYAAIGFLIAFGAWVIINTLLSTLGYSSWSNTDLCRNAPIKSDTGGPITTPTGPTGISPGAGASGATFTQEQALNYIKQSGANITTVSSGNCIDKNNPTCTSLDGIRQSTMDAVIAFEKACNCPIIITGGTEAHGTGACSHSSGCKVDIAATAQVRNYVTNPNNFTYIGTRCTPQFCDNAKLYKSASGVVFADEGGHFDLNQ